MTLRAVVMFAVVCWLWTATSAAQSGVGDETRVAAVDHVGTAALRAWCDRFSGIDAVHDQWINVEPLPWPGSTADPMMPPMVLDAVARWPDGYREVVFTPPSGTRAATLALATPDQWAKFVISAMTIDPQGRYTWLNPQHNTFDRSESSAVREFNALGVYARSEWAMARWANDHLDQLVATTSEHDPGRVTIVSRVKENGSVTSSFGLLKLTSGVWTLEWFKRFDPSGVLYHEHRFSEWSKPVGPAGWGALRFTKLYLPTDGRPKHHRAQRLLIATEMPRPADSAFDLDLRDARTVDRDRGVVLNPSGQVVRRYTSVAGLPPKQRWGAVAALGLVVTGVLAVGIMVWRARR